MNEHSDSAVADDAPESRAEPRAYRPANGQDAPERPKEIGGRKGPEPTRYGDWEKNGRCIDF